MREPPNLVGTVRTVVAPGTHFGFAVGYRRVFLGAELTTSWARGRGLVESKVTQTGALPFRGWILEPAVTLTFRAPR